MGGGRLMPGTRLGPYRVEAFLARGSAGDVYRATDERLGRQAAVKVLAADPEEDPRLRDRFLSEARAAAALDHPNVLPVYDAGDEDGTLWIAMRLAEGRDLRELLRRAGPLPPDRAVAILAGVAAALDTAHARGILHRDVKPANILLGPDSGADHAYLADFGLATAASARSLTRTGEVVGTIDYVSPEQARGEPLDARSDTWSLAAVLFECLTGSPPFRRDTEVASLTARLEAPAPLPSAIRADLPAALDPVLARGLASDPTERYPSAGALLAAAAEAVRGGRVQGILFADLRGYTAFAEREGDARAAALLARYRDLVRSAVARTGGAEIRTEGDSFYVIFPSATAAVRAGLAIAASAAAATGADPSMPIRPGIGVHAGEPFAAPEGPVGSAVNAAARLCALAGPGEVLVSATARDLARGSRDLAFTARGRHPVKGLAEPLEAWAARSAVPPASADDGGARRLPPEAVPRPAPSGTKIGRRARVVGAVAGAALLVVSALGVAALARPPAASPAASPAPSPGVSPGVAASSPGPPSAPTAEAGASPSPGSFPTAAEAALLAALPAELAASCIRGGTPQDARLAGWNGRVPGAFAGDPPQPVGYHDILPPVPLAGVTCRPDRGPARLYVQAFPLAGGRDADSIADTATADLAARWKVPDGACASDAAAKNRWISPGGGSGSLVCFRRHPQDGRPWIFFTFGKGRYLAFATRDDADYGTLYAWWEQLRTFLA